ncbi:putative tetratricopeptide-like helical [Rosellinia necatrix]|uniref:Putative tetratricopeptide-like helical n=1 Tax=Rosellinia necatrix TaxID=77044 RepID=A0A1S8AA14_ROSNE|nr:putative tetratricopeptide-like helical [Rosellinia necatrix]
MGVNWLRDLLPKHAKAARVLTYGYDASPALFLSNAASAAIQRSAECLVQELYADRRISGALKRPIIFVCHGLGGIVVKKSLVYSSTRTAAKIDHLWDQFVSTFAILFFSTPHDRTKKSSWYALEQLSRSSRQFKVLSRDRPLRPTGEDDVFFQSITAEFTPIMKQFHMFFFWEELRTTASDRYEYIVDPSSAVIDVDNTEKAGIHATHLQMIQFGSEAMSGFRTVVEAILRYSQDAYQVIPHRWSQAIPALRKLRSSETYELSGLAFDVHSKNPFLPSRISARQAVTSHFCPPQDAIHDFVGRKDMLRLLHKALFPHEKGHLPTPRRKTFVVFGMGGSGKTQLCSKFAEDHRTE